MCDEEDVHMDLEVRRSVCVCDEEDVRMDLVVRRSVCVSACVTRKMCAWI